MQLHGPPRLAGILRGYASSQGPIQDSWDDRSTYLAGRIRSRRKGPARLWPSWSFRLWVEATEWLAWRSDLEGDVGGEFDWSPRTRAEGDPDWLDEHVYRARCVSDLPTLSELRRVDAGSGEHVYVVDVTIEGVEPYENRPDAIDGGFTLDSEDADSVTVTPYGTATATESAYDVTFLGTTYNLTAITLGDARVVAARTEDLDDLSVLLTTRS